MTAYKLFVIHGSEQDQAYEIVDNVITIGRDRSCQIRLNDSTVSRHHARIVRHGNTLTIEDLGSNNGTFVNGVPVTTNRLRVDDIVTLGKGLNSASNFTSKKERTSQKLDTCAGPKNTKANGGNRVCAEQGKVALAKEIEF